MMVNDNAIINNNLYVQNGINAGVGGIYSEGLVSVYASSTSATNTSALTVTQASTGSVVEFKNATSTVFTVNNAGNTILTGNLLPSTTTVYNLGSSEYKWANIYAATATIGETITINKDTISGSTSTTLSTVAGNIILNPAGNVGIGTTEPTAILDVYATTSDTVLSARQDGSGNIAEFKNATGTVLNLANNGDLSLEGNFLPMTDNTYDLGSATNLWRDLYLGSASIKMYGSYTDPSNYELSQFTLNPYPLLNSNNSLDFDEADESNFQQEELKGSATTYTASGSAVTLNAAMSLKVKVGCRAKLAGTFYDISSVADTTHF